jgi:hypothetical protein
MAIVYQHRRNDTNEVFYIGIGKEQKRAFIKSSRSKYWKNIANLGYTIEITHKDVCWEEARAIECYLIAFYGRRDLGLGPLVNMTDGGEGTLGIVPSEETKEKIRLANIGKKHTEETKVKLRKPRSEQLNLKQSERQKGRKHSKETKTKISNSHIGKMLSDEHKKSISDTLLGVKHPEYRNVRKSERQKGKPQYIIQCPHCHKEGGNKNMKRWHFNNCKNK